VRAVRLLVWATGAALCAAMPLALFHVDQPATIRDRGVVVYSVSFLAITIGILVWQLRPDSRTGILMTAFGFAGVLPDMHWVFWNHALAVTVAFATVELGAPLFAHMILSYPTGRLTSRLDRGFVAFGYVFAALYAVPLLLFFDPRAPQYRGVWTCPDCALPLAHVAWYDVSGVRHALDVLLAGLAVIFLALLARKLVRASRAGRSIALPLSVAAFLVAASFLVQMAIYGSPANSWTSTKWFWIVTLVSLAIPVSLGIGLLRGRSARSAVADLVVELEHTPPGAVRDALARTLGDPTLELALWLPERESYVDGQGRPVALPESASDRAVTLLGPDEAPVAALVHDPVLRERPALLEAAGAAARLALENERLQAELRAQLAELRASRARIVSAGDEERQRLERDLHDGAQQRLLGLGLALQLLRGQLGPETNGATDLLTEADNELRAALDELRELARGIHPAVLTERGLGAALTTLAERSPVPVTFAELPRERFAAAAEAAAYFLVSEALANVTKYAGASRVRVSVASLDGVVRVDVDDDGVGGADPARGSGLRGLADRVHALDGELEIESRPGDGTHLRAMIPCA
jgi:signal transduction histidine kinase